VISLNSSLINIIILLSLIYFIKHLNPIKRTFEEQLLRFIKRNINDSLKINNPNERLIPIINYVRLIKDKNLEPITFKKSISLPKISFISPIYNKEKYLFQIIKSVQHQKIQNFELIFVDDCSTDKSINIINEFQQNDTRIKLIKNKNNKGTLYSRCNGALISKGEYISFIDSDDIVLQDGFLNAYNYIKSKNLSMVQFHSVYQWNDSIVINQGYYKYKNIIEQPFLSYIFYYNYRNRNGDEQNTALWDKLVERKTVLNSINFIGDEYIHKKVKIENDVILLFSIFHSSSSYQYINEIGYYYIRTNSDSITNSWSDPDISNLIVKGILTNINFLFEKTGDSSLEKMIPIFKLKQSFRRYKNCFKYSEKLNPMIKNIVDKLLNCTYVRYSEKILIFNIELAISYLQKNKDIQKYI